jgi:hypothetical protein
MIVLDPGRVVPVLAYFRARSAARTVIVMTAAYLFALQMLLAAVLAPQMALAASGIADAFVICHGDGAAQRSDAPGSTAPQLHHTCAVCVQVHATSTASVTPASAPARIVTHARFVALTPGAPTAQRLHDPRSSQGPPQAA